MPEKIYSIYCREAAREDCTPSIEAYYLKDWLGYDMPLHSHNQMEIMYVIGGRCTITTQNGDIPLKKNEFILLDAAVPHGLVVGTDAPCRIMNIEFTLDRRNAALPLRASADRCPALKRFLAEPRPCIVFVDTEDVHGVLRRVIGCLDEAGESRAFEIELLVTELFIAIARLFDEGNSFRHAGQLHVRRAMQFMNQNYYREVSIADVSAHVGIAEGYLSRVFKKSTGQTILDYLTGLRIRKAKMLLGKTQLPIVEISGYVGVPSRPYFNQLFKKHTGLTPSQYRKACEIPPAAHAAIPPSMSQRCAATE